ncbi:ATP-binding protein [bacterium]|nr:ATP-binding protein [bacterium]MBU1634404.1 ATP-binding protein [bacterium]MBU1873863.1 ATP-binding protein [bacterium]
MVYKSFSINCIIRVLTIAASIYLFFYLLFQTSLYATTLIVALISIYQVYALLQFVQKTNRDLTRFFNAIRYSDYSQSFTGTLRGSAFEELNTAFNEVIKEFQHARMEKEEHFRYLQTVVQHVGIGLIAFKQDGEVELINNAARRLLKVSNLRNLYDLEPGRTELVNKLLNLKPGEKTLIKLQDNENILQLSIYAAGFTLHQQGLTLISLQNIQSELEEKEMEAWQNLIRVLTHEIMNSVAPISSLASTVNQLLTGDSNNENRDLGTEVIKDVSAAVKTIEKRSKGLMNFVDNYRKLTRIPKPDFEIFQVKTLFDRVKNLMKDQFEQKSIIFKMQVDPETLELTADPILIEQVLINLCKNAVESIFEKTNPSIALLGKTDGRGNPVIQVIDNGEGIRADVADKIFIPFFTTKKEGSGIGLSLSKQIMRLHNGSISVYSRLDEETIFTLRF